MNIMDASKLILLYFVNSFSLLCDVDLILVGLYSDLLEQILYVGEVARTGLHIGGRLARVDPVSDDLLLVDLSFSFIA